MSIRHLIHDEVKRGPIALLLNFIMTTIAIFSLLLAMYQPASSQVSIAPIGQPVPAKSSYAIWLTIAVYLSVTGVGASTSRVMYRINAWIAVLLSIVMAVISLFLTTWVAQRLGLDVSDSDAGRAFGNLIFYGTLVIYLAVAGGKALLDMGRTGRPTRSNESRLTETEEAAGTVGSLMLAIALWGWMVGAGQTAAQKAFL